MIVKANLWVCHTCGHYFGSTNTGDLSKQHNHKLNSGERTHARSRCPQCGNERKLHTVEINTTPSMEDARPTY